MVAVELEAAAMEPARPVAEMVEVVMVAEVMVRVAAVTEVVGM